MIVVAKPEEIKAYYESEDLGQSKLKRLLSGIDNFNKVEDSNKPHFVIGSAVDMLLTGEEEEFDNTYYISEIETKLSEATVGMLNHVYNMLQNDYQEYLSVVVQQLPVIEPVILQEGEAFVVEQADLDQVPAITPFLDFVGSLDQWPDYIIEATEISGWQPKWGRDAKLKNIVEPGSLYFMDLCQSYGKKVIDQTTYNTIKNVVNSLRYNWRTGMYFDRETQAGNNNYTVYYQYPIYFNYRGVKCKALLDLVVVWRDADGRIIRVKGIDLKTMSGNTYDFHQSVKSRRYDIQAAWYLNALIHEFALERNTDILDDFEFVVESTTNPGKPLAFKASKDLVDIGKNGRKPISFLETDLFESRTEANPINHIIKPGLKGYEQLLDLYLYHAENGWSEEKEIQEAKGEILVLDWDGIVVTEN